MTISRFSVFDRLRAELEETKSALKERKVIEKAKGILMKNRGLDEEAAYRPPAPHGHEQGQAHRRRGRKPACHHRPPQRLKTQMTLPLLSRKSGAPLRIGFIPLADATALIIAVDRGFAAEEGLEVELVREVSWSNVRDRLNIGQFDAAHLLAPVAIASSLGLGHVRVPILAPFNLGLNGNAITVTNALHAAIRGAADGDITDPHVSATALARVVAERKRKGQDPLTFGMTFPYSTHNYQLRFWMASGGVDPDEDIRLVVLPPPFMVESIANGHVDAFCVGAPWNSVAVDLGIAHILHFVSEILQRAAEKVLAVREQWAERNPAQLRALIRAHGKAVAFVEDMANREEVCGMLAAPNRIGVAPEVIRRTLDGRLKVAPDGTFRSSERYLLVGRNGAARPDPAQAAWLYAQMVRWGQAPMSRELLEAARAVFRPDLYDEVLGPSPARPTGEPPDGIGAFAGPPFDPNDIAGHLAPWPIKRAPA